LLFRATLQLRAPQKHDLCGAAKRPLIEWTLVSHGLTCRRYARQRKLEQSRGKAWLRRRLKADELTRFC